MPSERPYSRLRPSHSSQFAPILHDQHRRQHRRFTGRHHGHHGKSGLKRIRAPLSTIDHVGKRWAMLTAVSYVNHGKNGARWVFHCHQCGSEKIMPVRFVRNGRRTSCGCKATIGAPEIGPQQSLMNAVAWPFPRVVSHDGLPVSPIWRAATER